MFEHSFSCIATVPYILKCTMSMLNIVHRTFYPSAEALPMVTPPTSDDRVPHSSARTSQMSAGRGRLKWEGITLAKLLCTVST